MTPEQRAEKIISMLGPKGLTDKKHWTPFDHRFAEDIAAEIREAVEEDRDKRTADDLYKHSYERGLEDAAKMLEDSLDDIHNLCDGREIVVKIRARAKEVLGESRHDGNNPHCGCDCKGCLGMIPGTLMNDIREDDIPRMNPYTGRVD